MIEELMESIRLGVVPGKKAWMKEFLNELRHRESEAHGSNEWTSY
jgi:hypothetical protein